MSIGDRLEDLLASPSAEDVKYVPRTEFDGVSGYVQTGPLTQAPADHSELLKSFGYDPDVVHIVGHPRVSKWQQRARIRGTSEYETTWLSAFKFQIATKQAISRTADLEGIATPRPGTGPHWMVFQAGDLQLGKRSRDGSTEKIVERYFQSLQDSVQEFKALKRHGIEGIQISMPGDMCEGNQSQA
jgi:hypothetical protein